jgi:hypothetical protein
MSNEPTPHYWFRAKRYGWGWGLATCWQGWAVYGAFLVVAMVAGALPALLDPAAGMMAMAVLLTLATAALVGVCMAKGEPPKWRWGQD